MIVHELSVLNRTPVSTERRSDSRGGHSLSCEACRTQEPRTDYAVFKPPCFAAGTWTKRGQNPACRFYEAPLISRFAHAIRKTTGGGGGIGIPTAELARQFSIRLTCRALRVIAGAISALPANLMRTVLREIKPRRSERGRLNSSILFGSSLRGRPREPTEMVR